MLAYIFAVAIGCFCLEKLLPGWRLPAVRTWPTRVVLVNLVQLSVVLLAGVTWERWLSSQSLFELSQHVSPLAGGLIAYFIATFVFYWWHRWRHEVDWLWLGFHQIHHSPRRIEVITSFYKHPLEMMTNSILGSLIVYTILGLSLKGGAVYTFCCALGEFFYHTNIRTPQWVGYVFQRPEQHRIHHEYGKHKNSYGDLPLWDWMFGTFVNPPTWDASCGFDPEKEERLPGMLAFEDVHAARPSGEPR